MYKSYELSLSFTTTLGILNSMKVILALLFVVGVAQGRPQPLGNQYGPPSSRGYNYDQPGGGHGGDDNGWDANYMFMYEVQDAASGNDFGHREQAMGHTKKGSYHVLLPDGRMQKVDYVADQDGYKPVVSYTGEASYGSGKPGGSYGAPAAGASGYRYRRFNHGF